MEFFSLLEDVICQDPGNRGISNMWQKGNLKEAANRILQCDKEKCFYVLTGFCCKGIDSETDGPLGSSVLCSLLCDLGYNCSLLCDTYSYNVVNAAANGNRVCVTNDSDELQDISCIISIERPGRSKKTNDFRTMRARDISDVTAPLDLLFTEGKPYLRVAVGDGGNEIGTGNIADQVEADVQNGADICTSICCDILIMAGVSNWGALAIAAALAIASNDIEIGKKFIQLANSQPDILDKMLKAGSYDGCTGKCEASIDGMEYCKEHLVVSNELIKIVKQFYKFDNV